MRNMFSGLFPSVFIPSSSPAEPAVEAGFLMYSTGDCFVLHETLVGHVIAIFRAKKRQRQKG